MLRSEAYVPKSDTTLKPILSSSSIKRIVPPGTTASQHFTVLFIGQVEVLSEVERKARKATASVNRSGSAMAGTGMNAEGLLPALIVPAIASGFSAFSKKMAASKGKRDVASTDDTAVCDTEFGDIHYKLCLVSKSQQIIGELYNIRLDGFDIDRKLYTSPTVPSTADILSGIVQTTAKISSDRLVLISPPELNFLTVLGTQIVNLSISPLDSLRSKIGLLSNAFCDIRAMFVHRVSIKGGKHSSDFEFEPVKTKCALLSLATGALSLPVSLKLEISAYHLTFDRFSAFYITLPNRHVASAIMVPSPPHLTTRRSLHPLAPLYHHLHHTLMMKNDIS
ncbi:hypothetical protein BJ742DRAFT_882812 [Cladochytrium replicatum]|nr:hypothetical protein BJ742DRAFT_882812 [Cladochytrium replicatum]